MKYSGFQHTINSIAIIIGDVSYLRTLFYNKYNNYSVKVFEDSYVIKQRHLWNKGKWQKSIETFWIKHNGLKTKDLIMRPVFVA